MEQIRAITVNNVTYNVAQASAIQQKKLMLLIGAKIGLHSAAGGVEKIDTEFLVGSLLSLPEVTVDEVTSIVASKVFKAGSTDLVTVDSFQGGMVGYFQLVAEAVAFNLNDFFTWLDNANSANRAPVKIAKN